jgi:N-hydroxyarylamine O-acetyltransferase
MPHDTYDVAAPDIDLPRYLSRIGYDGPIAPTLEVLAALQAAHIAAIPFEAIDALTGAGIDIAAEAVDAKLIVAGRGGYCFEQNGLFLRVLQATGFAAEGLLGRVRWVLADDAPPTPRTHMVVRVMLDGRPWLADVGFGAAVPPVPLAMDITAPQATPHESYRIARRGDAWQVSALLGEEWATLYLIDDVPPPAIDYVLGNWYTSTHPDSHFRNQLVAARTTAEARYGLRDNRLSIRFADGRTERRYLSADEIDDALASIFLLPVRSHWRPAIERAAVAEIAVPA